MKALVAFNDNGAQWTARFLKPGFSHVFVALLGEHGWIVVEGESGNPTALIVCAADYDLKAFYEARGCTVVETVVQHRRHRPRLVAGTCLGLVKAFIGVGAPWIVTPHQLYRYLTRG